MTTVYVVVVPFLGWILKKGKPDRYCVISAFIAIAGIGLLTLEGDFSVNIGDILTLACGILFAFQIIYIDQYTETDDPVLIAVWQMVFAAVYSWAVALAAGGEALDKGIDVIISAVRDRPHIFNLGHGIIPQTPIEHVERLVERVKKA